MTWSCRRQRLTPSAYDDCVTHAHATVLLPKIRRRKSKLHGFGVFALEPINKNKRIIDYAGELITNKQSESREDRYLRKGCIWVFRVNRDWSRDANVDGNVARFINHSCKPNCWVEVVDKTIWIRAARNIERGRRADLRLQHRRRQDDPVPVSSRVQDQAVRSVAARPADRGACSPALVVGGAGAIGPAAGRSPARPIFVRSLAQSRRPPRDRDPTLLDTPILPGSVMKAVTLVAALESQVIEPDTARMCRRTVTVDGRRYVCSHPDLKRPLTPAEALAHSCNDFFVSLAPRLPATALNDVRARLGLPPVARQREPRRRAWSGSTARASRRARCSTSSRGWPAWTATARSRSPTQRGVCCWRACAARPTTVPRQALGVREASSLGQDRHGADAGRSLDGPRGRARARRQARRAALSSWRPARRGSTPRRSRRICCRRSSGPPATGAAAGQTRRKPGLRTPPDGAGRRLRRLTPVGSQRLDRSGRPRSISRSTSPASSPAKGEPSAAMRAQQALAITARTFALANLQRHRREDYDLCDTTHCQVMRASTAATRRAAEATAGRVLVHQGQPASVFYSAWCGGHSELASESGRRRRLRRRRRNETRPVASEPPWASELRVDEIERALRAAGHRGDRLRDLRVLERNDVESRGAAARRRIHAARDFRPRLSHGGRPRRGMAAHEEHGVRRSPHQRRVPVHAAGALVMASGSASSARDNARGGGTSADEILRFYFPTLRIGSIPASPTLRLHGRHQIRRPHSRRRPPRVDVLRRTAGGRGISARASCS